MKKQIQNPFLPLNDYIPDGEPHVFGDRIYLFGSHDKAHADSFCELPYLFYSAPLSDLSDWTAKEINYDASQDPLSKEKDLPFLYAPDVVKGNDGRYYLYYSLAGVGGHGGYFGPISVAVSDTPDGKYEFLGHLRNPDGSLFDGGYVQFDPAVINDDGVIRLYYGTYYPFSCLPKIIRPIMRRVEAHMFDKTTRYIKEHHDDIMGPVTCVLDDDMFTVKTKPVRLLPVHSKNDGFLTKISIFKKDGFWLSGHGFYEGSSIRKINGRYYFIYSSMQNDELAYAISDYPDRDFTYGGVIVSTGDTGYEGRKEKERRNYTATTHGSIECVNGQWYVFYHRQTHGGDYSRQACAEKITIREDGFIPQVEVTSSGMNPTDLNGHGFYPAGIVCNLSNGHMPHHVNGKVKGIPMTYEEDGNLIIKDLKKGCFAVFKYFDLSDTQKIILTLRGNGKLSVSSSLSSTELEAASESFREYSLKIKGNIHDALKIDIMKGKFDILGFELK